MKQMIKHITVIDIAKRLWIFSCTVSRGLNGRPGKKRVKRISKVLQYPPHLMVQSLRNNRTMTIGVIVPEIKHDFFSSAISGIEEIAYKSGYAISYVNLLKASREK